MTDLEPVVVTGSAHKALADKMREWSKWPDASLILGPTESGVPSIAITKFNERQFVINPDRLILNPHRYLGTITPFRLRQEAALTGVLLHEAAHARFSTWMPRTPDAMKALREEWTEAEIALAKVIEEPRIEAWMAKEQPDLAWTMLFSSAKVMPAADISSDPTTQITDLVRIWLLKVGRLVGQDKSLPLWAETLKHLLVDAIQAKFVSADPVLRLLEDAVVVEPSKVLPYARKILSLLFPETDPDDMPVMEGGCSGSGSASESGEGESEEGESGSGESGSGESGESGSGEDESDSDMSQAVADILRLAEIDSEKEKSDALAGGGPSTDSAPAPAPTPGSGPGVGTSQPGKGLTYRHPTPNERDVQRAASRFLRNLIAPSEGQVAALSEAPSSQVDGPALSAWKSGGRVKEPRFFRQTRREVKPSPPVKIGILVDVSMSMDDLQAPSHLLSWALSNACLDLKNFAGRGQQVESCLIHWGDKVLLVSGVGDVLPGIVDADDCNQYTTALPEAFDLLEKQMPAFFTPDGANKVLVMFTDWEISYRVDVIQHRAAQLDQAGVTMVTITIPGWSKYANFYTNMVAQWNRGKHAMHIYGGNPLPVWSEIEKVIR